MARWSTVVLVLCLVTATTAVLPAAAAGSAAPVGLTVAQEFDRAEFRIAVFPNGSARWTFRYERTLVNDTERRQFETFAADFNANETRLYTDFRNQSRALVRQGADVTNREMTARAFHRRAFVGTGLNEAGVVEMAFTWTGFASTSDDRVVVGDVFEGGLYLGPDQALVIAATEGLAFRAVEPAGTPSGGSLATSDTVTWMGERTFTDNRPRVVLDPTETDGEPVATTEDPDGGTVVTTAPPDGAAAEGLWALAVVIAVIVFVLGMFIYRRRGGLPGGTAGRPGDTEDSQAVHGAVLMDDEERIETLLEDHGGRMRQSALVDETGWSKSKVSMVLSEMVEADRVRKLQVGRENIISLPGHEPDAAGSPHEDGGGGGES